MSGAEIALGTQVAGTVMSSFGQADEGNKAEAYSRYQSAQLRRNARQEVAASQRTAEEQTRQSDLVASRALAVAAASGGGASDPGVIRIIADIDGEGAYRRSVALYQGEEAAAALEEQAVATEFEGAQKKKAGRFGALSTLLKGGAGLYGKFGDIGGDSIGSTSVTGSAASPLGGRSIMEAF